MATETSVVQEALRYTYGADRVAYLANQEVPVWNIFSKVKKPVGGRGQFILPVLTQNPGTFKGVVEGGSIPTSVDPATTEATYGLQEFVGIYDLSWKLLQDARNSKFAFQQAITMLDEGLKRRIFRLLNADLLDNGKGRLGVLSAADNDTTITVNALPRVEKGMVVDIMDLSDDDTKLTGGDSVTVTAVDPVNRTITISGAGISGSAAGDYFVIEDTCDDSVSDSLHSNGLLNLIDDANPDSVVGNVGNLNRSTAGNEFWKSVVLSNGGANRALTEDLMLQALDSAREKGSGMIDCWLSNLALVRRYHEMLKGDTYFALSAPGTISGGVGREKMENGGAKGMGKTPYTFSGIPWKVDPYFAANTIVGVDTSHFFLGVGENDVPRPISEVFDNVPFFKETSSTTFEVVWYYQMQMITDNPAAGVKIEDVAEA